MGYIGKETRPRTTPLLLTQRTCPAPAQLMENISSPCTVHNRNDMFKYNWTVFCSSVTVYYFFFNGNVDLWFLTLVSLIGLVGWCMFTLAAFGGPDVLPGFTLWKFRRKYRHDFSSCHNVSSLAVFISEKEVTRVFFSCCIICCLFLQNCKSRNM